MTAAEWQALGHIVMTIAIPAAHVDNYGEKKIPFKGSCPNLNGFLLNIPSMLVPLTATGLKPLTAKIAEMVPQSKIYPMAVFSSADFPKLRP